jgi:hypothetical protein
MTHSNIKLGLAWAILALLVTVPVPAKFGISKTRAVFVMYFPPAFHVPLRELRLKFVSDIYGPQGDLARRLELQVSQALTFESFRLSDTAPTVLQASLDEAWASVDRERRPVKLNLRTGERVEKDKNGKEKKVEECKSQQVDATFLTSRGRVLLNVTVADAASRAVSFSHRIERSYLVESMVDGPRLCSNRTYSIAPDHLRHRADILALLADQAVAELIRLATGFTESRTALLAVDDELKPGNGLALAGNWPQAQAAWQSAFIEANDRETQAARAHNLGVAREVMAVEAMRGGRLDEAEVLLGEADRLFAEAISLDGGERYFRDPLERIKEAYSVLEKMKQYRDRDQAATDELIPAEVPGGPAAKEVPGGGLPTDESPAVRDYRLYVRARLEAHLSEPDNEFRRKLLAAAPDYAVAAPAASLVVESEAQRLRGLLQAMAKYEEDYKAMAADGILSSAERDVLRTRQKTLRLPDSLARAVEARFPVRL